MDFFIYFFLLALVLGLISIASNPTPYFGALGLVVASGVGCGILVSCGGSFLSLVLFLIYLGGMLVVFAYSTALAADSYPEAWGSWSVIWSVLIYLLGVSLAVAFFWGEWYEGSWAAVDGLGGFYVLRGDTCGVAVMYSFGGWVLFLCAWALLLTLFVVLELTRGLSYGALRAI
uniref:NADH-ubiquinone oxidoreductase chain 6 n=1 Tax=Salmostoma bacalia TaxID=497986 RepID=F3Y697_9TELE|nr:NADH dehydrogenase subunit 6 [Salmostoma bacalia]BAK22898.1 NADH dehydrogenase subunit 6 [Salmostoma bacalia]